MASTSSTGAGPARRSPLGFVVALLGLAGIIAIFLPFAWSTSPASAVTDGELWYLAVPFLLATPITAAHVWLLTRGHLPPRGRWGSRGLAGGSMAVTALFYAAVLRAGEWPGTQPGEWVAFVVPMAMAAAWVWLMVRWRPGREGAQPGEDVALMEAAWLVNAALCLLTFITDLQAGGYVMLAVAAAFAAHVVATLMGRR